MEDPTNQPPTIYLSRRNLEALLSKLNRYSNGEETQCAIIKEGLNKSTDHAPESLIDAKE